METEEHRHGKYEYAGDEIEYEERYFRHKYENHDNDTDGDGAQCAFTAH